MTFRDYATDWESILELRNLIRVSLIKKQDIRVGDKAQETIGMRFLGLIWEGVNRHLLLT